MAKTTEISETDVKNVATSLHLEITDTNIQFVLENYDSECFENDPDATWDLIVENLIYNTIDKG